LSVFQGEQRKYETGKSGRVIVARLEDGELMNTLQVSGMILIAALRKRNHT